MSAPTPRAAPVAGAPDKLAGRVRTRLRRHRAWRFARSAVAFLLMSAVVFVLVLQTRDTQALKRYQHTAEEIATRLQAERAASGAVPVFPEGDPEEMQRYLRYFTFNHGYPFQILSARLVGVCHTREIALYLRASGRMVVLFDGEAYSTRFMKAEEFAQRARSLGFTP